MCRRPNNWRYMLHINLAFCTFEFYLMATDISTLVRCFSAGFHDLISLRSPIYRLDDYWLRRFHLIFAFCTFQACQILNETTSLGCCKFWSFCIRCNIDEQVCQRDYHRSCKFQSFIACHNFGIYHVLANNYILWALLLFLWLHMLQKWDTSLDWCKVLRC